MPLYHYDRSGLLKPGERIDLSRDYSAIENGAPGSEALLRDLFPDGLSRHGLACMRAFRQWGLFLDASRAKRAFGVFLRACRSKR
jgi:hypothetical protein